MLHSVREGILGVDRDLNITIVNEEAARIFEQAGIDRDLIGKNAELAIPNSNLRSIIETGQSEYDQEQEINGIHILTNRVAIRVNGNIVGAVATFRDKTYILKMAEDLTGVKLYADALRSQTHEFLNRLHVILGMIHMGHYDRLSDYIHEISDKFQDEAGSLMQHIKDPVLAGFIMAKLSHARECGVFLSLSDETFVPELGNIDLENDLTTLIGNLLENAMEAVVSTDHKDIELCMTYHDDLLSIVVRDSGEGIPSSQLDAVFKKGYSTRGENRGYGMYHIKQILEKYQGNMEISSIPIEGTEIFVTLPLKRGV
jgi:CitB family two-component system sensor histidine kinase MalK